MTTLAAPRRPWLSPASLGVLALALIVCFGAFITRGKVTPLK